MHKLTRCVFKCNIMNKYVGQSQLFSTGFAYRDNFSETSPVKAGYQSVADYYAGKSVFVTGATGFVGRVLIERLLFTCKDIDNIYVLIRGKKNGNIQQRLQELLQNPIFTKLRETRPQDLSKVVPIAGDVSEPMLGINMEDERTLVEKVSVIFHSAANTKFRAPLYEHMKINYEGTKKVLQLGTKVKNLDAFLHVSTLFTNSADHVVNENPWSSSRNIEDIYKIIDNHSNESKEVRQLLDKGGNSYIFAKKMAEICVANSNGKIRTIIVRPSMVTSVFKEPLEGYTDSWVAGTGLLCDIASGLTRVVDGNKNTVVEIIPVDYVTNFLIVTAAKSSRSPECKVYNYTTGPINPINWGRISKMFIKESKKHGYGVMPFPSIYFTNADWAKPLLLIPTQVLPALVADMFLILTGRKPRYMKLQKQATSRTVFVKQVTDFTWKTETTQTRQLLSALESRDKNTFPCDPATVDWNKYIPIYCKGVKDYMLGNNKK